jgi:tetratricopeptide (TPR) repeat protein
MNDFYAYDNPSKIKETQIINLVEKILKGMDLNTLHKCASEIPVPPKYDFNAPALGGLTHTQIEAKILEEIVRKALINNDLAVLATIYDVATWRFSSVIWHIDWFIQTVNMLWDYYIKVDAYDIAMRFLDIAVQQNPEEPSFQKRYALFLHAKGDMDGAEAALRSILNRNSNDIDALVSLGKLCYDKGDLNEALNYLNTALVINPTDQDVQQGIAVIMKMKERRQFQGRVN